MPTQPIASLCLCWWILGGLFAFAVVLTAAFCFLSRLSNPARFNLDDPAAEDRGEQP